MITNEIKEQIEKTLKALKLPIVGLDLEHPTEEKHGDYASNVALILFVNEQFSVFKDQFKNPRQLAARIVREIKKEMNEELITKGSDPEIARGRTPNFGNKISRGRTPHLTQMIEKIEVAGPGFINFYLKKDFLVDEMRKVLKEWEEYGRGEVLQGKKIAVEYTDPNPFKEFHIGHLYSNLIGESIARIFEANGAEVWRGDFYGDVGMHVAKSVWGMMRKLREEKISVAELSKKSMKERQNFLGQGYALGVINYEQDEKIQEEIKDLNYLIYIANQEYRKREKGWKPIINYAKYVDVDPKQLKEVQEVYEIGLGWSLDYFETIYKRLGTKFDGYYPESWVGELGMKIVEKGLKKGVLSKSKGAVVYEGEQDGLHTRVFVNKLGLPTYEAKDLGLAEAKYQDFKYDLSLNIFGKEIDEYYKVVKAALRKIEPELGKRAQHLAHGMVNLPEGKMSSRTGNIITCEWLLNETKKRVLEVMQDTGLLEKDKIAEMVAQGAVKYAFLKNNIGDYVIFDFGSSISFQGNSGPYIQYTYARARSVLARAKTLQKSGSSNVARGKIPNSKFQIPTDYSLNDEEMTVLRWIYRYPELVEQAAREYAPHLICTYLYELAQRFNAFYNKHSILGILEYKTKGKSAEDMKKDESKVVSNEVREFRLCLTVAVAQVLKNGLHLLGIQAPEKM